MLSDHPLGTIFSGSMPPARFRSRRSACRIDMGSSRKRRHRSGFYEERAAILEHDQGMIRLEAEILAHEQTEAERVHRLSGATTTASA